MHDKLIEALWPGEYYIWTVHFTDGSPSKRVKITSDSAGTRENLERHFGKSIADVDYSFSPQNNYNDRRAIASDPSAGDYHRAQDQMVAARGDRLEELSVGKMQSYKDAAGSEEVARRMPLRKVAKHAQGVEQARHKISKKMGNSNNIQAPANGAYEAQEMDDEQQLNELNLDTIYSYKRKADADIDKQYRSIDRNVKANNAAPANRAQQKVTQRHKGVERAEKRLGTDEREYDADIDSIFMEVLDKWNAEKIPADVVPVETDEAIDPWHGYTKDDPKRNALAKAPKSTMVGSTSVPFSSMVQDSIKQHGIKWAFQYYVIKHGLPPRQFRIFAGI